jgi:hypothetical protein
MAAALREVDWLAMAYDAWQRGEPVPPDPDEARLAAARVNPRSEIARLISDNSDLKSLGGDS